MTKHLLGKLSLLLFFSFFTYSAFAWNHSVEIGYGWSHDPNNSRYFNQGVMLSGDLYPLRRTPMTFWSITGSLGHWHSSAPVNKNVTTAAASLALRFYPFMLTKSKPYLLASVGPAYLSQPRFGTNVQASHGSIQTNLGLGDEFNNHYDVNLRLVHYSNAGLGHINEGYNFLYFLSLGYLF